WTVAGAYDCRAAASFLRYTPASVVVGSEFPICRTRRYAVSAHSNSTLQNAISAGDVTHCKKCHRLLWASYLRSMPCGVPGMDMRPTPGRGRAGRSAGVPWAGTRGGCRPVREVGVGPGGNALLGEPFADHIMGQLGIVLHPHLLEDTGAIGADRLHAQGQLVGNFLDRLPHRDHAQDFVFTV